MTKENHEKQALEQIIIPPPEGWVTQRRWTDTCGCIYQEALDPNGSETSKPRPHKIENLCPAHWQFFNDPIAHHAAVYEENVLKNQTIFTILNALPDQYKEIKKDSETGEEYIVFKNGDPIWSFDSKRELQIAVSGITSKVRKNLEEILKDKFPNKTIHLK